MKAKWYPDSLSGWLIVCRRLGLLVDFHRWIFGVQFWAWYMFEIHLGPFSCRLYFDRDGQDLG